MRSQLIRLTAAVGLVLLIIATVYAMIGRYGEQLLRQEVESQFARLLDAPVSVRQAKILWRGAPEIVARGLETFPTPEARPLFVADRIHARLDLRSLVTGNLRLEWLRIDGARLEIRRLGPESWQPGVLFESAPEAAVKPGDLEPFLDLTRDIEAVARGLLQESGALLRIEIENSRVLLFSGAPGEGASSPQALKLEDVRAQLVHDRFGGGSRFHWESRVRPASADEAALEFEGERRADGFHGLELRLFGAALPALAGFLVPDRERFEATGSIDLNLRFETNRLGSGDLSLDATLLDLKSTLFIRAEPLQIESPRLQAQLQLEFDPERIELIDMTVEGLARGGRLLVAGAAPRPLRDSTRVRLSAELRGAGHSQLRNIISWLPHSDAEPLERILGRVTGGQVSSLGASGRLPVSQWNDLLRGRLTRVPKAFVLAAKMEDLAIGSPSGSVLAELTGEVQWSGDRIELVETKGLWNGRPLPKMELRAEGISFLFEGPDWLRELSNEAPELPGLDPLVAWFEALESKPRDPTLPAPLVRVFLENLEHPALRWPLRDAALRLSPIEQGTELRLVGGQWAGANVEGEALFLDGPDARWLISLRMSEDPSHPNASPEKEDAALSDEWAWGSFETASLTAEGLPVLELGANFSFRGTQLRIASVEAVLDRAGVLTGAGELDLGEAAGANFRVEGSLQGARLEEVGHWFEPGEDWGTGEVQGLLDIRGRIEPGTAVFDTTRGAISLSARNGEVRYEVPLALAVAQATIGFNPPASREHTAYDSIEVDLQLEPGRISTENFALYGETRVFASGAIEFTRATPRIDAVVGIFLLGALHRVLDKLPLVRNLVSKKGLVGSYFAVEGALDEPDVRSLPAESIQEAVPHILKLPFIALGALPSDPRKRDERDSEPRRPSSKRGKAP